MSQVKVKWRRSWSLADSLLALALINPKQVADIIISSLEGALMMSRLEGDRGALAAAQSYLASYLDTEVRLRR